MKRANYLYESSMIKRLTQSSFVRGGFLVLVIKLLGAASTFGVFAFLGNRLGTKASGIYAAMFAVTLLVSQVARFGSDGLLLRNAAVYFSDGRHDQLIGLLRVVLLVSIPVSIVLSSLIWIFSSDISSFLLKDTGLNSYVEIFSLSIPFVTLYCIAYVILQAQKRNAEAMGLLTMCPQIFCLAFLYFLVPKFGDGAIAIAYGLAAVTCSLVGIGLCKEVFLRLGRPFDDRPSVVSVVAESNSFFLGAVFQQMTLYFETIAIASMVGAAGAGVYSTAIRVASVIYFVFVAINGIAAPRIAALHRAGDLKELRRIVVRSAQLMTLMGVPLLLLIFSEAEWLLSLFGKQFSDGAYVLRVLCIAQISYCLTGPSASLLLMTGHQRAYRNVMIFCGFVQVGLGAMLILNFGAVGASISFLTVVLLQNVAFVFLGYKYVGVVSLCYDAAALAQRFKGK